MVRGVHSLKTDAWPGNIGRSWTVQRKGRVHICLEYIGRYLFAYQMLLPVNHALFQMVTIG